MSNSIKPRALGYRAALAASSALQGAAAIFLLSATPARAACTVDGDTTTCTGDLSSGVATDTPNVVIEDVTTDISSAGPPAIWMPGLAHADIDLGGHSLIVGGVPAIASLSPAADVELDFVGTINATGAGTAFGSAAGMNIGAFGGTPSNIVIRSTADITIVASRDPAVSPYGNVGISAQGGEGGSANVTSTGDISLTVTGEPLSAFGLYVTGSEGAAITSKGDITVAATGGGGAAIWAGSNKVSTVDSEGDISLDLGSGNGHAVVASGMDNTIHSVGDITVISNWGSGIAAIGPFSGDPSSVPAPDSSSVTSVGDISTSGGISSAGILALGDEVTVNSEGDLTTVGTSSDGIVAMRRWNYDESTSTITKDYSASSVSLTSKGDITVSGGDSVGIRAGAIAGTATVVSTGDITATAGGIIVNGKSASITSTGTIKVTATGSPDATQGLFAQGDTSATVKNTGNISVTAPSGGGAAIFAGSNGTTTIQSEGNLSLDIGNSVANAVFASGQKNVVTSVGNISVNAIGGSGIAAIGPVTFEGGGAVLGVPLSSTVSSTGNISTTGKYAAAIQALGDEVTVTSTGNLTTTGPSSDGIFAMRNFTYDPVTKTTTSDYSASTVSVTSKGNIAASGSGSAGIRAGAIAGTATVVSTGDITATAGGIIVNGKSASITSTGTIKVTATGTPASTQGLFAQGDTSATVKNTGNISVTAPSGGGAAIFAGSNGTTTIQSEGNLSLDIGNSVANAVFASGQKNVVTSVGNISVNAIGGSGIAAIGPVTFEGGGAVLGVPLSSTVSSTGNISTTGKYAAAIHAEGDEVTVTSTGNLTTTGPSSEGIFAMRNFTYDAGTDTSKLDAAAKSVSVTSKGNITTSGIGSAGIRAGATKGAATVASTGDIKTSGANAHGIDVQGQTVTITSTGAIAVTGSGAHGIVAAGGTIHLNVAGSVSSGADAIRLSGTGARDVTINAGTTVTGGDAGIRVTDETSATPTGLFTLTNQGKITGGSDPTDGAIISVNTLDLIRNSGSLYGRVDLGAGADRIENSGLIDGAISFGAGDDVLLLTTGSNITGIADGGANTDTVLLQGTGMASAANQTLSGTVNFELLDVSQGYWRTTATANAFNQVSIRNGATLEVNGVLAGNIATTGTGTLVLGAAGDVKGNLVNDGVFIFQRTDDYIFGGDFSGTGALKKYGAGTLTFAGLYDFTGTTSIFGGAVKFTGQLSEDTELEVADGVLDLSGVEGGKQTIAGLAGTGGSVALGSTKLVVDQSGDSKFDGSVTGTGTLIKEGDGDLKLNGDGKGFTGTGQVDGGTLSVNGNFSNAGFVVNEGGTLGGAGVVGPTKVAGGTLAPGNSIDTLTVAGNASFTSASTFEVEVNAAGASDLLKATGTATLGNAKVSVLAANGTYKPLTRYTILTAAGGISGTFGSVDTDLAFLDPYLDYSANAVTLALVRNDIEFSSYGTTPNQIAIAELIGGLGYGNDVFEQTLMLAGGSVASGLESLTGEFYPAYGAALVESAELLRRQTASVGDGSDGAFIWGKGLYQHISSGGGAHDVGLSGAGFVAGAGFGSGGFTISAGAGTMDQNDPDDRLDDGNLVFATARVSYENPSGISMSAGGQLGWVNGNTSRQIALGALGQTVTGDLDGNYTQLFAEIGYRLKAGSSLAIEPFAGISHVSLDIDDFAETGGAAALAVSGLDRGVTFGSAGIRLSGTAASGLRPYGSVAYRHTWGERASQAEVGFAGTAGRASIGAVPIAESAAELQGGLVYSGSGFDIELGYEGTLSKTFKSHGIKLGARVRF